MNHPADDRSRSNLLFQQIAGQPGGAKGAVLNDDILKRAEARLQDLAPLVREEVGGQIAAIEDMARSANSATDLFNRAHQVRGIAGTFGFPEVGVICGALCDYGHDAPPGFAADWRLIQSLAGMLAFVFAHPDQLSLAEVTTSSRSAVQKTLAREGRLKTGKDLKDAAD